MIKYLGSKRTLLPVLGDIAAATGASTALDLFTGTTRVAREFKRRGLCVTAADVASYSKILADCYIATDAHDVDQRELRDALRHLSSLPGQDGYFTETFCVRSRYFQPKNGARVDAIRDCIEADYAGTALYPVLLTSLMLAADRVDSTTGVQMAYLKQWAPRAHNDLELRPPELLPGPGEAVLGDASALVGELPQTDLAYLDPPYNQHRYFTNYHIWETLVRWDAPESYGVACKRIDSRDDATKSVFNRKREMPGALREVIARTRATMVVVSYNNESWISPEEMTTALAGSGREEVQMLAFDSKRYVGAQIGIHDPRGQKVGTVSHLRNQEYLFLAGPAEMVRAAVAAAPVGGAAAPVGTDAGKLF
ncbi:MAG TPA: DNA adenine methylase [Nocardioidaceae bacterium]|nr:DNA adenine methylase [Nocardioidaceae bacterium]